MVVSDFSKMKMSDYLDTGKYKNVLILFHHGLGDAVIFHATCLCSLKKKYPDILFHFSTSNGQEKMFGKIDETVSKYDICFKISFPCSDWGQRDETKYEKCARTELGIDITEQDWSSPIPARTPFVGVHFNSTCAPQMNCPIHYARKLYEQIKEAGLIPIDTHMRHCNDNKKSIVYDFQSSMRIDNLPASLDTLLGVISTCRGFAGVPSGNITLAHIIFRHHPERILYMTSDWPSRRTTREPVLEVNIRKPYDKHIVNEWIQNLLVPA